MGGASRPAAIYLELYAEEISTELDSVVLAVAPLVGRRCALSGPAHILKQALDYLCRAGMPPMM